MTKVGDSGYFKSGKDAPWELGKTYHGASFTVIKSMIYNGRLHFYLDIRLSNGRWSRRWATEPMLRFIVNHPSPQLVPLKKITLFDFKSGMNSEIYHSRRSN